MELRIRTSTSVKRGADSTAKIRLPVKPMDEASPSDVGERTPAVSLGMVVRPARQLGCIFRGRREHRLPTPQA
jgi:hypothetical protein